MISRSAPIAFALALGLATHAVAQSPVVPLIALDSTEVELVERSAAKTTVEFSIPARLNVAGVTIRRWSIAQGGRLIDPQGSRIELQNVANRRATLFASFNLNNLNVAGSYIATVEFTAPPVQQPPAVQQPPGQPAPAPAARPEPQDQEQTVQLKLTKPAGELRVSTPLQIERTVRFVGWSSLEPNKITLNEASGKSWVRIDPTTWNVVLRRGNEPAEDHRLTVRLPGSINGWGQGEATIDLEGPISVGTTSGALTIRAPQLAAQTVDFPITIISRVSACWLFVVIVIGVGVGWYFRNYLEARRARLDAVIPAEQELGLIDDFIAKTADPTFKERLQRLRRTLAETIDARASSPEIIKDRTGKATTEREKVSKEIGDLINTVRGDLEKWRKVDSVAAPLPANVRAALDHLREAVGALANRLDSGVISGLDAAVTRDLSEEARKLRDAVKAWFDRLGELADLNDKPWPETKLAGVLTQISADADKLKQATAAATTPDALWNVLLDAAQLLQKIQDQLFRRVLQQLKDTAALVSKWLVERDPKLQPQSKAIDNAVAKLPDGAAAGMLDASEKLVSAINAVRAAIVEGLKKAWNDPTKSLPGLTEGRFGEALAELDKKPKPGAQQELGGEPTAPASARAATEQLRKLLEGVPEGQLKAPIPVWGIILEASDATVSEPVTVRAKIIMPQGRDQPDVTLRWSRNGQFVGATSPGTLERSFTFAQPGPVSVEVSASDRSGASALATLIVHVQRVHGARAIASLEETLTQVGRTQNIVAGAIIIAAGCFIFTPTFVGTLPEFFAAFLWGFSADIGAAKVRELTESVKALKPPIPIPKPSTQ